MVAALSSFRMHGTKRRASGFPLPVVTLPGATSVDLNVSLDSLQVLTMAGFDHVLAGVIEFYIAALDNI